MATPEQIAKLRQLINEPDSAEWPDERIAVFVDGSSNLSLAAADAWAVKAGELFLVVDVSESGSSRKLSGAYSNAMKMAAYYRGVGKEEEGADSQVGAPFSIPIVRRGR